MPIIKSSKRSWNKRLANARHGLLTEQKGFI
jgi:hypothetical protein